eukprot:365333-Chlamydomonas_euryale.AAC.4
MTTLALQRPRRCRGGAKWEGRGGRAEGGEGWGEGRRVSGRGMGRLEVTHSTCLRRIVGVKLTDRHRLETIREQCGTPLLEVMVRKRTLQWMGHVLRMDEDRLPRQVFDCSLARSVAEDGRVEQLQLRPHHRNIENFSGMYSSTLRGCHEESSGGGTTFRDFLKLPGHTQMIPWPAIRAAAAERALDR